jgi:hypothetical protein
MFTFGSFLEITEVAQIFGILSYTYSKSYVLILKNGLGNILGGFFTNSSGHPVF